MSYLILPINWKNSKIIVFQKDQKYALILNLAKHIIIHGYLLLEFLELL